MSGFRLLLTLAVLLAVVPGCDSDKRPPGTRSSAAAYSIVGKSGKPGLRLIISDSNATCEAANTPYWTIDLDIDPAQAYEKTIFAFESRALPERSRANVAYKKLSRSKVVMVTKGSVMLAPRRMADGPVSGAFELIYFDKPADRYEEVTFSARWCGRFQDYLQSAR